MNQQKKRLVALALSSFLLAPLANAEELTEKNGKPTMHLEEVSNELPTQAPLEEKKVAKHSIKTLSNLTERIQLHGYAQAGYTYRTYPGLEDTYTNTFDIKRTILWANAQITDRWSFLFMHDFNSSVQEFYTDYRLTKSKALFVRFGQFKNAYSLENPLSPTIMETVDVYSEGVTFLSGCGSDALFGVHYGRDLGVSIFGEIANDHIRYELQVMNGQGINVKDRNHSKDVVGRLEFRPLKGLNIVGSWYVGRGNVVEKSIYNWDLEVGENYHRERYSFGADYRSRRFNIHGEFLEGKDEDVSSRGCYATGSLAILPGKVDLVGSYDYFNFNDHYDMEQHKVVFGAQYWYYPKCRLQLQYVYKTADATPYSFSEEENHGVMAQVQIRFN